MKFLSLLKYIRNYKSWVVGHVISNLLMVFFSVASIPALIPFLSILFGTTDEVLERPTEAFNSENFETWISYYISGFIAEYGQEQTLAYLCGGIVIIFLFKNLFRYLALFFLLLSAMASFGIFDKIFLKRL